METKYLQVFISAENRRQADAILDSLLKKRLVAGGMLMKGSARFWWKGKITEMNYLNISAFTIERHQQAIINDIKKTSAEEVPLVWFSEISVNKEMEKWVTENLA